MISIVIIVKNDPGVKHTIKQLLLLPKIQKTEIIVVDSSKGKLDYIKNKFPKIKWISYISKTKKKITIPEQRNLGVQSALGNVIVFIDANCIPTKNWLNLLTKPILEENENIVCGKTISSITKTLHDQFNDRIKSNDYVDECATINLAVKKIVFDNIGLFDTRFDYGSDVDFIWRAVDADYKIRYIKTAIISHDWGNKKDETRRSFRYGAARALLYKKHWNRLPRLMKKDYFVLFYVLFIVFLPLFFFCPLYIFLLIIPFFKNINKHPFQVIQDHLVYASGFIYQFIDVKENKA